MIMSRAASWSESQANQQGCGSYVGWTEFDVEHVGFVEHAASALIVSSIELVVMRPSAVVGVWQVGNVDSLDGGYKLSLALLLHRLPFLIHHHLHPRQAW